MLSTFRLTALIFVRTKNHALLMALFISAPKFFLLSFLCMSIIGLEYTKCVPEQCPLGEQVLLSLKGYRSIFKFWTKVDGSLSVTIQQRRIQVIRRGN